MGVLFLLETARLALPKGPTLCKITGSALLGQNRRECGKMGTDVANSLPIRSQFLDFCCRSWDIPEGVPKLRGGGCGWACGSCRPDGGSLYPWCWSWVRCHHL